MRSYQNQKQQDPWYLAAFTRPFAVWPQGKSHESTPACVTWQSCASPARGPAPAPHSALLGSRLPGQKWQVIVLYAKQQQMRGDSVEAWEASSRWHVNVWCQSALVQSTCSEGKLQIKPFSILKSGFGEGLRINSSRQASGLRASESACTESARQRDTPSARQDQNCRRPRLYTPLPRVHAHLGQRESASMLQTCHIINEETYYVQHVPNKAYTVNVLGVCKVLESKVLERFQLKRPTT